jgi:hypothetical protein
MEQPMSEQNQPVSQPAANSPEAITAAIENYKQQHAGAAAQLNQLEQNYQTQKKQLTDTLLMLAGAVAAMEQLTKNIEDEAKAKAEAEAAANAPGDKVARAAESIVAAAAAEDTQAV